MPTKVEFVVRRASSMRFFQFVLALVLLGLAAPRAARAAAGDHIWIEAEKPASVAPPTFKPTIAQGDKAVLSGGAWLSITADADKVDALIPDSGVTIAYPVTAQHAGDFDLWLHVGFEQARAPFEWRIDNGDWHAVANTANTLDVTELGVWAPVAWLDAGKQNLAAGQHTLEIHLTKPKNKDGKSESVLFGLDAIHFAAGPFHPDGAIQPGDTSWQTEADKAAAAKHFELAAAPGVTQTPVSLDGDWQYAGDDETIVEDRLGPTTALPALDQLNWHAMRAGVDRNKALPHEQYVHRYYLRTRIDVRGALAGHSFVFHAPAINMIATLFVNGRQVAFTRDSFAVWDVDITKDLKSGASNEIVLAFKDIFYGLAGPDNVKHPRYVPFAFWHFNLTHELDMPVLSRYENGFPLGAPSLVVGGATYVSDVFTKPSVKDRSLGLQITLHNAGSQPMTVTLDNEVTPASGGAAEKKFAPLDVTVQGGTDQVIDLSESWANPKLWWPDSPNQYVVHTRLSSGGKPIDERATQFGFRQITWDGPTFSINGVPWHVMADTDDLPLQQLRAKGQNMVRVWAPTAGTEKYLDECDAFGMLVRRTGIFDGEGADGLYSIDNPALWDNYRHQMIPWLKGQRNHPSIFMWSSENEISFINGHVFGQDKITTEQTKKSIALFQQIDPTRPFMTDGGNAALDESLPIYGGHYMEPPIQTLPEGAYGRAGMAQRQVWPVTNNNKPILLGEAAYVAGNEPGEFSTVGGERAFLGRAEARDAIAVYLDMLGQGYRWSGISFHFWVAGQLDWYHSYWAPAAVLCRQWDWTFASGQHVKRTLGIFNNTHDDRPLSLTWTLTVGGKQIATNTAEHHVSAGGDDKFDVTLAMPQVKERTEGTLSLTLSRGGETIFTDSKAVSVLSKPYIALKEPNPPAAVTAVFDPSGRLAPFLKLAQWNCTSIDKLDLTNLPAETKVLVIGPHALTPEQSTSSALAAWASSGKSIIVLEQKNPLKFQALPGEMVADTNAGCMAFPEDPDSPLLYGLKTKDFATWGPDNQLYRDAYEKPISGGKSIIQCDVKLSKTALVQMQAGSGVMLLSQLLIGEKLNDNVVAQRLLLNLVNYAYDYRQTFRDTVASVSGRAPLAMALAQMGLKHRETNDALSAIAQPGTVGIINASPANLKQLADNLPKVQAFTAGGGWIVLNRLTPEGLADYNKLVGVNHLIRPFHQEKVTWPAVRDPLTAGVSGGSIVMTTGKSINGFSAGEYVDPHGYSYVVDLDEVAPFASSTYYGWPNAINNFTQVDGFWQLIQNLPAENAVVPIKLARKEKLTQVTWVSDNNYEGCSAISVSLNGKDYRFATQPNGEPQTFDLPEVGEVDALTVKVVDWTHDPKKLADGKELVGIDNIYLKAARPADVLAKVKPMLNIGAMVRYPQGAGGIILCNVDYRETEENPINAGKKQAVLAGVLHNLQCPFTGGKTIIAGMQNLQFEPISLAAKANQFRGETGWFGDKAHSFDALPAGKQTMAGVTYDIYHFTTSPVPEAVMLNGPSIPGNLPGEVKDIAVGRKADALFFLQAARIDDALHDDEKRDKKQIELAHYVVHYADGQTVSVPILLNAGVGNYRQEHGIEPVSHAQVAWSHAYADGSNAVAYSMQWTNPHPELDIKSIDVVAGPDHRGVPALLALTAATAR